MQITTSHSNLLESTRSVFHDAGLSYLSDTQVQLLAEDHCRKHGSSGKVEMSAFQVKSGLTVGLPVADYSYSGYPSVKRFLGYDQLKAQYSYLVPKLSLVGLVSSGAFLKLAVHPQASMRMTVDLESESLTDIIASTKYGKRYLKLGLELTPSDASIDVVPLVQKAAFAYDAESFGNSGKYCLPTELFLSQQDPTRSLVQYTDIKGDVRSVLDIQKIVDDSCLYAYVVGFYRVERFAFRSPRESLALSTHLAALQHLYAEAKDKELTKLVIDLGTSSPYAYKNRLPNSSNSGPQHFLTKV